jgi:peptidoglycan-N-acetylmuramic acid deacetylase
MKKSKRMRLAAAAVFLLAVLGVGTWLGLRKEAEALEAASWGLSFPRPGESPVGNATAEELAVYDAAYLGDPSEKVLYLTFDAGYENGHTAAILDVLAKHRAPAAFFVVGTYIEQNPELVRRMVSEGHIVGNHTWHHWDMDRSADRATFTKELEDTAAAYEAAVGAPMPRYYRPPRGVYAERNLSMAQDLGYRTVFWSLAYVDWKQDDQPSHEQAFEKLLGRVHNGAVVLLHSTSATNAQILDELLTKWEEMGYRFATLEELFDGGDHN